MAQFCGYCGVPNEGGKFCTACGRPIEVPSATPAPPQPAPAPLPPQTPAPAPAPAPPVAPAWSPAPQPAPTYQRAPQPAPQPAQQAPLPPVPPQAPPTQPLPPGGYPARPSAVNPFVGVPVSDYVRDAAALLCLFATLGMPWDLGNDGSDRWWVTLSVLLAALAVSVPYIGTSQVVPGWTRTHVVLVKSLACIPFFASVLAVLVNELVNVTDDFAGGIGTGVGVGLAGAILVLQPRASDETLSPTQERGWTSAFNVVAVVTTVAGVASFVAFFLDDVTGGGYLTDDLTFFMALIVGAPLMFLVVVGWPALASLSGSGAWRRVLATSTFTVLAVALLSLGSDGEGLFWASPVERWNSAYAGTFLVGATAALAVTRPAQRRSAAQTDPVTGWLGTAASALMIVGAALVVSAVELVLIMVYRDDVAAAQVVVIVLLLISTIAAVTAMSMLGDIRRSRAFVLGAIGVQLLLSVISVAVFRSQDDGSAVSGWMAAMWFTLPSLALWSLLVPGEVRQALGPLVQPTSPAAPYNPQMPGYPPPGAAQPPHGYPNPAQPPAPPPADWPR